MMNFIGSQLDRRAKSSILAVVVALIALIAAVDALTSPDISLGPLYWMPVAIAAWYLGTAAAVGLGFLCAALATGVDALGGRFFIHPGLGNSSEFAGRALSYLVLAVFVGKLRDRTRELHAAIRQLRAFDYSIAHDLRSPVRTISSFAEVVLKKAEGLDQTSRHYVQRIEAAGFRLSAMLDGLLLLSDLSRRAIHLETVDLGALARQILADLEQQLDGAPRELVIPESLYVLGDRQLLTVLLHNLLQNAWKFTGLKEKPRIELGIERCKGGPAFFVRDNGEGFDPALAAQLFQPFRRLPNAERFSGQGIGLATAAKAVEVQGGRIWADGSLGRGATVFFTLGGPS